MAPISSAAAPGMATTRIGQDSPDAPENRSARTDERWHPPLTGTRLKPATIAVHADDCLPESSTKPLTPPIYQSAVYVFPELDLADEVQEGRSQGFLYSRVGTPNGSLLEAIVAELEACEAGAACASGMAAIHAALLAAVPSGGHVVATRDIYGGTFSLLSTALPRAGVAVTYADTCDLAATERAFTPETKALYVETLSNPTLRVSDIPALAEIAHRHGALLIVDNTFASPYVMRPAEFGADVVVNSATKYLNGHGDVIGGVITGKADLMRVARGLIVTMGSNLDPFAAWLIARGIKTLPARMERHCANAQRVAEHLVRQPLVERVNYPGLAGHPQHELAARLMPNGFGGMLSFLVPGEGKGADAFIRGAKMIKFAPSLADVSTTLSHPGKTSHRSFGPAERAAAGVSDGLIRLSVGIEAAEDIIADIDQALKNVAEVVGK